MAEIYSPTRIQSVTDVLTTLCDCAISTSTARTSAMMETSTCEKKTPSERAITATIEMNAANAMRTPVSTVPYATPTSESDE